MASFAVEMLPDYGEVIRRLVDELPAGGRIAVTGLRDPEGWPEWLVRLGVSAEPSLRGVRGLPRPPPVGDGVRSHHRDHIRRDPLRRHLPGRRHRARTGSRPGVALCDAWRRTALRMTTGRLVLRVGSKACFAVETDDATDRATAGMTVFATCPFPQGTSGLSDILPR